jgi:hypothetical protein
MTVGRVVSQTERSCTKRTLLAITSNIELVASNNSSLFRRTKMVPICISRRCDVAVRERRRGRVPPRTTRNCGVSRGVSVAPPLTKLPAVQTR